jgi:SAM-dependent methyltransferase
MILSDDDTGEASLPLALQLGARRLVQADIYDAAEWYDVDYAGYLGELRFYRRVCEGLDRGDTIVELGAGTGRLTRPLLHDGYGVWAVEPSSSMRARLLLQASHALGRALWVEDALGHTFVGPPSPPALVIFPFNGILHVRGRAALDATLGHIKARLRPGGRFALDQTVPYWESMRRGRVPWGRVDERVHPTTGESFLTCDRSTYDRAARLMTIDIRYALLRGDELIQTKLEQFMWTSTEMLAALERADFVVEHAYGDVDLSAFHEGAPRLLVVARAR